MVSDRLSALVPWKSSGPDQEAEVRSREVTSRPSNRSGGSHVSPSPPAQVIESRTLALARSLTQQLQTTCLVLVSSLKGLPTHIQQEALSLSRSATQMYSSFSKAKRLGELPDSVLSSSRVHLGRMKDSLDSVMDYLVNNTPLNWLVGPFFPRMAPEQTPALGPPSVPEQQDEPTDVEMESLPCQQES